MIERKMRRKDRSISHDECIKLLENSEYGVLATADQNGQPYGVPLSYIALDERIYFHGALAGHKVDNILGNPKASFTIIGLTQPVYNKGFTTYYESVVVFGSVTEIVDESLKSEILYSLVGKYLPDYLDRAKVSIPKQLKHTSIYALSMERVTGKANRP